METPAEPTKAFHPMLSYQVIKYIGAVFLVLNQLVNLNKVSTYYFTTSAFLNSTLTSLLGTIGQMGLPLLMIGTVAGIMRNRKYIFVYLIAYGAGALSFLFLEQAGIVAYLYILSYASGLKPNFNILVSLKDIVVRLQTQFVSINVFVDLFLVAAFFFFLFYNPKKHVKVFRSLVALPAAYLLVAYILMVLSRFGVLTLNVYVLSMLPSKKMSAYAIVLSMLIYLRIFSKDRDGYSVNSKTFAVYMSFVVVFICIIDAFFYCLPNSKNFCVGNSYMLFTCVPLVLLFDYKATIKHRWISWTMPVFYIVAYGTILYFYTIILLDLLKVFAGGASGGDGSTEAMLSLFI